jgi:hypothetical protein
LNKIKGWYNSLSDQWKATLRTAWQNFTGTIVAILLLLFVKATDWVNGGPVDWVAELDNAGRLFTLGLITLCTSIITFFQNRGNHGGIYIQKAPVEKPRDLGQIAYSVIWLVVGVLLIIVLFVWLTRNVNV